MQALVREGGGGGMGGEAYMCVGGCYVHNV